MLASGEVIEASADEHAELFWALKHDVPALPFVPPDLVGERLLMLISMWLDDADDPAGAELVDRLAAVGTPCVTASTVLPFGGVVQKLLDEEFPDGQRYYTKEAHVSELADEVIDALVSSGRTCRCTARSRSSAWAGPSATWPRTRRRSPTGSTCCG